MAGREIWSFFSGAMGFDLGLEQAGLKATLAVENNPKACETIRANRPRLRLLEADVCSLTRESLRHATDSDGEVFLFAGGPPCQSFSSGGKRAALSDPRGNLIYEYLRLIGEVRPRFFILENVANIVTAALRHRPIAERPGKHWNLKRYSDANVNGNGEALPLEEDELGSTAIRHVLEDIKALEYEVVFGVLDAAEFGAPQHRMRFVMIGCRDQISLSLPKPMFGPRLLPYQTVADAIEDLQDAPGSHSDYTPRVRAYFEMVPPGGNWRDLPREVQVEALGENSYAAGGGKTGFYRRLSWDAPSPTVTGRANRKGSALCHPAKDRPLSVRECARLQGFPDDWVFCGAMNSQYQQIGNAVPVALGKAVGDEIRRCIRRTARTKEKISDEYESMLAEAIRKLRSAGRNKKARARDERQLRINF